MDKYEMIQEKIKKMHIALENMEDEYRTSREKLEQELSQLDDYRLQLQQLCDEFSDISYHFLMKENIDQDIYKEFNSMLENYLEATDTSYREKLHKWEERDDELTTNYKKQHSKMEDDLEEAYFQRRKAFDEQYGE